MRHLLEVRVVYLDTEVANRRLEFRVTEQKLHGAQVLRTPVDQRRLGSPHRVRAVVCRVKAKLHDPTLEDAGVLARPQMRRVMIAAREHEVIGLQSSDLDPLLNGVTGRWRDLELDGTLSLVLHHDRSSGHLLAVADVPDLEGDEVTTAELAVDSKVEECEVADPVFHLKSDSKCPDVPGLERRLLANDLALVPWLAMNGVRYGSHDGLIWTPPVWQASS